MNKIFKKFLLVNIICFLVISTTVFAKGEGSKRKNNSNGLKLESSNPKNNDKDIPIDSNIKLTFSNNVVNILVKDNNSKCFKLYDEDRKEMPIKVEMADDEVEREKRKEIEISPKEKLKDNGKYVLEIDSNLKAKNGSDLGKKNMLTFTTKGTSNKSFMQNNFFVGIIIVGLVISSIYHLKKRKSIVK